MFFVRPILLPNNRLVPRPAATTYRRTAVSAAPKRFKVDRAESESMCRDGAAHHHARGFNFYARPHGGGNGDPVDKLALGALWLGFLHGIRERPDVFHELVGRKRSFADARVDDAGLLDAELDGAALRSLDGAGDVHRHSADLGVRHHTARA